MTVLEELRGIEDRVTARLRELAPLVSEFEELRAVADRLGIDVDEVAPGPAATASPRRGRAAAGAGSAQAPKKPARARAAGSRPGPKRGSDTKAIGAQRRVDVLKLIQAHPGLTVAQVAERLSVDRTGLYRVIRRLEADGQIRKEGAKLLPAG
jgi:DNA-binding IclR family transcriptional regulator